VVKKWIKEEKLWKREGWETWIKEEELWKENKGSTVYMDKRRRRRRMKHGCKKKENSGSREGW
jgi:hypothetical protein